MKLLHLSDTHGDLPKPDDADVDAFVHTGDLCPNHSFGIRVIEQAFQPMWLAEHAPRWDPRYRSKPFLIVPGNHDFVDPTPPLRAAGIDARLVCNGLVDLDGVAFYGHPWTPIFYNWNWMCGPDEMRGHLSPLAELLEQGGIDVLMSHGPMFGVLDRNQDGERCGCKVLRDVLQDARHLPKLLLHGHIHEAAGVQGWSRGMVVSNAARTQRVVVVPRGGAARSGRRPTTQTTFQVDDFVEILAGSAKGELGTVCAVVGARYAVRNMAGIRGHFAKDEIQHVVQVGGSAMRTLSMVDVAREVARRLDAGEPLEPGQAADIIRKLADLYERASNALATPDQDAEPR